jgi:tetratricopeptide (TPR) repeat protein
VSAANPELQPLEESRDAAIISPQALTENIRAWGENKTLSFATDLVSSAFVVGLPDAAREAAKLVLDDKWGAGEIAKRIARSLLSAPSESTASESPRRPGQDDLYSEIHLNRQTLQKDPRNPLVWLDLARTYTILGVKTKAEQALVAALNLAPHNRYVLRSAARFFIHGDDPQHAHQILLGANKTRFDPWLLAAEIAVSCIVDRPSRLVRTAKAMLDSGHFHPSHLSELSSALATLELVYGNAKKSRGLFRQSLVAPTDNSVAQFRWAGQHVGGLELERRYLETPFSFEARAWEELKAKKWQASLSETWNWFFDQPFSVRPVLLGSFLALTMMEDFVEGEKILRLGLVSNRNDPIVLNNLTFALASQGKEKEAGKILSRIDYFALKEQEKVVITATKGLLEFRRGNPDLGRKLYLDAIADAKDPWGKQYRIRASAYLLQEEMIARSTFIQMALGRFLEEAAGSDDPTTTTLRDRLIERYNSLGINK